MDLSGFEGVLNPSSSLSFLFFFNSLKLGEFGEGEIPNLGHFLGIFIFTLN